VISFATLGVELDTPHATAASTLCSPTDMSSSTRSGAAPERSSRGFGPVGERSGSDRLKWPRGDGYMWPQRFGLAGGLVLV
jgi:hypothetical protein